MSHSFWRKFILEIILSNNQPSPLMKMIASLLVAVAVAFATTEAYTTTVTFGFDIPPGTTCSGMFVIKLKDSNHNLFSANKIFGDYSFLKSVSFTNQSSLRRHDYTVDLGNVPAAKYADIGFHPDRDSEGCEKAAETDIKIHYVGLTPEGGETSMFTVGGQGPSDGGKFTPATFMLNYYHVLTRYGSEPGKLELRDDEWTM